MNRNWHKHLVDDGAGNIAASSETSGKEEQVAKETVAASDRPEPQDFDDVSHVDIGPPSRDSWFKDGAR